LFTERPGAAEFNLRFVAFQGDLIAQRRENRTSATIKVAALVKGPG
jgi:hypothetical protein